MGNPAIEARAARGIPHLAWAEAEAAQIASQSSSAVVLTGARATKAAFLDKAGAFTIVHFAGHAIANESYPLLSRLLFARDEVNASSDLFSNEILLMNFAATRLVVLAACRTAAGPIRKGEGAIGLARPFLARGVASVVGTLWDIDDHASQNIFKFFYAALRDGMTPAAALRAAQVALIRDADSRLRFPDAWAGFVVTGGS